MVAWNGDFFAKKKEWSRVKDSLLKSYLEAYVPKVAYLEKPIVVVDCFAGAGKFGDEPGSPLIIARIVKPWRDEGKNIRAEFIEADPNNFRRLQENVNGFHDCSDAIHGKFQDQLERLTELAKRNTVFLYVDPYTVRPLVFDRMKPVFDQIRKSGSSVEMLLNLNVPTFMRWGRSAVLRHQEEVEDDEGADYLADDPNENVELAELDGIAGGDYWRKIARDPNLSFARRVDAFTAEYRRRLNDPFAFVASYAVREKYANKVPKYVLVYCTRNEHGFELMNDGMFKARKEFLKESFPAGGLFDLTPEHEIGDPIKLANDIVEILGNGKRLNRKAVRVEALKRHLGFFEKKEINGVITEQLKARKLFSERGKTSINDEVLLSTAPFTCPQTV
jgi:three-Cys-motif partner protein